MSEELAPLEFDSCFSKQVTVHSGFHGIFNGNFVGAPPIIRKQLISVGRSQGQPHSPLGKTPNDHEDQVVLPHYY